MTNQGKVSAAKALCRSVLVKLAVQPQATALPGFIVSWMLRIPKPSRCRPGGRQATRQPAMALRTSQRSAPRCSLE